MKTWIDKARRVLKGSGPECPDFGLHPNWPELLAGDWDRWQRAIHDARKGPEVLIATSVGNFVPGTTVESALAVALTLRGVRAHLLLCDQALPACFNSKVAQFPDRDALMRMPPSERACKTGCFESARAMYESLGLPVLRYGNFITEGERSMAERLMRETPLARIGEFMLDGLAVGEHAMAGALRFYARGDLESEPEAEAVTRQFFRASLLTTLMARRLFSQHKFISVCFNHGIYVPQGPLGEVARRMKIPVVNWNPAYRKSCFIFSHGDTYHHTLLDEPTSNWDSMPWTPEMESDVMAYLKSRWQGTQDWIWFHDKPDENLGGIVAELGLDPGRPWIGMLSNVMWDAQLHYRANAFPNMLEWVRQTIRYFAQRPDLQLILRIHPAEIRGTTPSRQPLLREVQRDFPSLPGNVVVIPPDSRVSTYAVMQKCNAVLIFGTKTGIELTSLGVPVIVAGEAWIRNKGLTLDASSPQEYARMLERLPFAQRLDEETLCRARKYAYHFFFRRMIPLEMMVPAEGWPPYRLTISGLDALAPGCSPGLDTVCNGILSGSEFIYPAERLGSGGVVLS